MFDRDSAGSWYEQRTDTRQLLSGAALYLEREGRADYWAVTQAVSQLEKFQAAAAVQMDRIWSGFARADELHHTVDEEGRPGNRKHKEAFAASKQAFIDIFLYFSCCNHIRKCLELLIDRSGLKTAAIAAGDKGYLNQYGEIRSHLEHWDTRLLSSDNKSTRKIAQRGILDNQFAKGLPARGDMGNLIGEDFTFGGKTYPVGPSSLERINQIVEDFFSGIRDEVIGLNGEDDEKRALERAASAGSSAVEDQR